MKYYKIYGLIIKSDIKLYNSNLISLSSTTPDIEIVSKSINTNIDSSFISRSNFYFSQNNIIFIIENVGRYQITNGNKITIEYLPNTDLEEIRKYILGSALGLLLFQRNIIALHGSSIVINNNAIIISGNIGAGKTSTTLSLVNKGYSFLTDDVASVIKDINGTYNVHHCIPYQKLCLNTIESLGYDKNKLIQIDKIKNKY